MESRNRASRSNDNGDSSPLQMAAYDFGESWQDEFTEFRRPFLRILRRHLVDNRITFKKFPMIGYKDLDFYHLFLEVVAYGGFQQVVSHVGTWSLIWKRLRNFDASITDSSFRLKKNYERFLLRFEKEWFGEQNADKMATMRSMGIVLGSRAHELSKPRRARTSRRRRRAPSPEAAASASVSSEMPTTSSHSVTASHSGVDPLSSSLIRGDHEMYDDDDDDDDDDDESDYYNGKSHRAAGGAAHHHAAYAPGAANDDEQDSLSSDYYERHGSNEPSQHHDGPQRKRARRRLNTSLTMQAPRADYEPAPVPGFFVPARRRDETAVDVYFVPPLPVAKRQKLNTGVGVPSATGGNTNTKAPKADCDVNMEQAAVLLDHLRQAGANDQTDVNFLCRILNRAPLVSPHKALLWSPV